MIENIKNTHEENKFKKKIGYWFNEKKSLKFGASELDECCRNRGLSFTKVHLDHDLEEIGKYNVVLHKFTAILAPALAGDLKAKETMKKIEMFIIRNPNMIIIDPLPSILKLLLRVDTYEMLSLITSNIENISTPKYVVIKKENLRTLVSLLQNNEVSFPVVCKPLHAGGSKEAHQMALIFNMEQLRNHCPSSYIAQSFINHNAVLYKIFVIGLRWFVTTRPSLKNFEAEEFEMILFNSHSVSKPDSCSPLTCIDSDAKLPKAELSTFKRIVSIVREALKSELFGIDVIIDVSTGINYIIDVNPFPSFDSVPDVMNHIAEMMRMRIDEGENFTATPQFCLSSDLEQKYILEDIFGFLESQKSENTTNQ